MTIRILLLITILVTFGSIANAQTMLEYSSEARFQLDLHVPDAVLAGFLPPGWTPNIATQGAAKDANLRAVFIDRVTINGPDGKPRDAINDGQRTIRIDIHRWPMLVTQPNGTELQVRLAVHEYLGIARIEGSDNYSVSDSIIALLKQNNFSITQIAGKPPVDPIFSAAVRVSGGSAGAVEQAARKGASDAAIFKCTQATGAVCKVSASQVIQSWSQQDWMGYSTYYCDASAIADPTSQK